MCDCDEPTLYNISKPRAKKVHVCCECRAEIMPGQVYARHEGLWEGSWDTFKLCIRCQDASEELHALTGCCIPFGTLQAELAEAERENARSTNIG